MRALILSLGLTAQLSSVALAESASGIASPESFAQDHSTQGQALIAESPTGPLGLRFSGGLVIDGTDNQQRFGINDLDDAATYVGVGVSQNLGAMDISADLGWMHRPDQKCSSDACKTRALDTTDPLESEPVVNLQFRFRF